MKTTYKNIQIDFDREFVPESEIKWYGSTWINDDCLICEGGETLTAMCEALYNAVTEYEDE